MRTCEIHTAHEGVRTCAPLKGRAQGDAHSRLGLEQKQKRTPPLTEKTWQSRVVDLARLRGWRVFHPYDSRRSAAGWPDLAMVRGGRMILAELKTETGKLTVEQQAWLTDLSACPGVETFLWRPSDWPEVQRVLA